MERIPHVGSGLCAGLNQSIAGDLPPCLPSRTPEKTGSRKWVLESRKPGKEWAGVLLDRLVQLNYITPCLMTSLLTFGGS